MKIVLYSQTKIIRPMQHQPWGSTTKWIRSPIEHKHVTICHTQEEKMILRWQQVLRIWNYAKEGPILSKRRESFHHLTLDPFSSLSFRNDLQYDFCCDVHSVIDTNTRKLSSPTADQTASYGQIIYNFLDKTYYLAHHWSGPVSEDLQAHSTNQFGWRLKVCNQKRCEGTAPSPAG